MNLKLISPTVSTFPIFWHILCNSTVIGYELILRLKASAVNCLLFLPNWMSQNYDLFHPGIQSKKQLIFFRIGLLIWSFDVWVLIYLYGQLVNFITILLHKKRVTSLNSKQAWRVYCHFECFVCLFNWLVAIIDYWFNVVSFSVVYIAYVRPFFLLVWCLISVLVWIVYLFPSWQKSIRNWFASL